MDLWSLTLSHCFEGLEVGNQFLSSFKYVSPSSVRDSYLKSGCIRLNPKAVVRLLLALNIMPPYV